MLPFLRVVPPEIYVGRRAGFVAIFFQASTIDCSLRVEQLCLLLSEYASRDSIYKRFDASKALGKAAFSDSASDPDLKYLLIDTNDYSAHPCAPVALKIKA
jgi:hypothetical protein